MPGRPRTMLKRVDEMTERAEDYGNSLYNLMPPQYLERPDGDDPVCMAWRRAGNAAVESCRALYALRELIERKVERAEIRGATSTG